eukprot:2760830-Amphidinium_carterae.1
MFTAAGPTPGCPACEGKGKQHSRECRQKAADHARQGEVDSLPLEVPTVDGSDGGSSKRAANTEEDEEKRKHPRTTSHLEQEAKGVQLFGKLSALMPGARMEDYRPSGEEWDFGALNDDIVLLQSRQGEQMNTQGEKRTSSGAGESAAKKFAGESVTPRPIA